MLPCVAFVQQPRCHLLFRFLHFSYYCVTTTYHAGGAGGGRRLGFGDGLAPPVGVGGRTPPLSPADDAGEGSLGDADAGPGAAGAGTATEGLPLPRVPGKVVRVEPDATSWLFQSVHTERARVGAQGGRRVVAVHVAPLVHALGSWDDVPHVRHVHKLDGQRHVATLLGRRRL